MTVTIIRCNGEEEVHTVPGDTAFDAIARLLGAATLDTVNLGDGRIMLVDDHGYETAPLSRESTGELGLPVGVPVVYLAPVRALKPPNARATELYHAVCKPGTTHQIVGDVALVRDLDF